MKISHLYIYPIKSLAPVALQEAEIWQLGLKGDREMMLVDTNGKFITQRTRPELTRFEVFLKGNTVVVKDKISEQTLEIEFEDFNNHLETVQIWDDEVNQVLLNAKASFWFSEVLSEKMFLVKMNYNYNRTISQKHITEYSNFTSFADSLPILLCTSASFKEVEKDFGTFDWLRFRPNIIVENDLGFEEDSWDVLEINGLELQNKKCCARCNLINLDPQTAVLDKTFLGKLSKYRTVNHKVNFGIQIVPQSGGHVKIGDRVQVKSFKDALV